MPASIHWIFGHSEADFREFFRNILKMFLATSDLLVVVMLSISSSTVNETNTQQVHQLLHQLWFWRTNCHVFVQSCTWNYIRFIILYIMCCHRLFVHDALGGAGYAGEGHKRRKQMNEDQGSNLLLRVKLFS